MRNRKKPQALATHPQLGKIIEAYLEGQSPRQISKWCKPPVSHTSIWTYAKNVIDPTMKRAEELNAVVPPNKIASQVVEGVADTENPVLQLTKEAILAAPVLSVRANRIAALEDRHKRLQLIVDERAAEMKGECAGGASGLLARDYKGKNADTPIYRVDTGLLNEFREHERQVAIELGQWQEAQAPSVAIQIVMPQSTATHAEAPVINLALPTRQNR